MKWLSHLGPIVKILFIVCGQFLSIDHICSFFLFFYFSQKERNTYLAAILAQTFLLSCGSSKDVGTCEFIEFATASFSPFLLSSFFFLFYLSFLLSRFSNISYSTSTTRVSFPYLANVATKSTALPTNCSCIYLYFLFLATIRF